MGTSLSNHRKRRSRTCAVITFGDSYANNYEATKILRALSLPWTFFVSAGIVGTDNAFPHGLERLGHRVPPLPAAMAADSRDGRLGGSCLLITQLGTRTLVNSMLNKPRLRSE